jgi:hypothetical protein
MIMLGTNSIKDTGYDVANSLRFNSGSSDYLNRTLSTPTNRRKWTFSMWVKRSNISSASTSYLLSVNSSQAYVYFNTDDTFNIEQYSGGYQYRLKTNRVFRDTSAWYHLVIRFDSTNGTADDRVRIYINGVQETSFSARTNPSLNFDGAINNNNAHFIGRDAASYWGGYMSEITFIDGQSLDPTSFGEFDEDSGIWKPIDVSGLTFGTNGFYLDFENSGALGADVSGNTNNFTVNNLTAIDQSISTPTNIFATGNPLFPSDGTIAFSEGNLKLVSSGTNGGGLSTFGVSKGKWYIEVKQTAVNEPLGNGESLICVVGDPEVTKGSIDNYEGRAFAYGIRNHSGTKFENTSGSTSWHGNWTAGDIISIALDMDNNRVYFAKNGQYADGSGNWDEAFTSSPAHLSLSTAKTNYFIGVGHSHGSATETFELNTGSPSFAISSGNTDGDGYGNFEYAVPSGYYSLNTKNLAEYG